MRTCLVLIACLVGCEVPTAPPDPLVAPAADGGVTISPDAGANDSELVVEPGAVIAPPEVASRSLRLISPLSTSRVWSVRPTIEVEVGDGDEGARIEICRDRACTEIERTGDAIAVEGRASWAPSDPIASGAHWFRAFGLRDGVPSLEPSATWELSVVAPVAGVSSGGRGGTLSDVDGDGLDDLVSVQRTLHLHRGSATGALGRVDVSNPWLAQSAHIVGDLDGDGRADVAVRGEGRVSIVYGGDWTAALRTTELEDPTFGAWDWGTSVVAAGDVDGDGFGDLAVGCESCAGRTGQMFLHHGSAGGVDPRPSVVITNPVVFACNAWSSRLASIGDVDRDGYGDLVIGGYASPLHVYRGGPEGPSVISDDEPDEPDFVLAAGAPDGSLSMGAQGDADGDGRVEVFAVAYDRSSAWSFGGLDEGRPSPRRVAMESCEGTLSEPTATWVGDVDGDGAPDWTFGSCGSRIGIVSGSEVRWIEIGILDADVRAAGDLDGDGIDDLWIPQVGTAVILFGAPGGPGERRTSIDTTC